MLAVGRCASRWNIQLSRLCLFHVGHNLIINLMLVSLVVKVRSRRITEKSLDDYYLCWDFSAAKSANGRRSLPFIFFIRSSTNIKIDER